MSFRELDAEEGGGYFASVSDLMVGILFVFLLMLTVFALNYREEEHRQEVSRALYEQAREEATKAKEEARQQEARANRLRDFLREKSAELQRAIDVSTNARDRLLTSLQTTLKERGVPARVDRQAGILHLPGDMLFLSNSATLSSVQRDKVDTLADALAETLPCFTPMNDRKACDASDLPILETVLIEGHTDHARIHGGLFRDNDQLSTERALTVFAELQNRQTELDKLLNVDGTYPLLGFSGFGDRRPLPEAKGDSDADYAQNRRIDLRFLLARNAELERLRSEIDKALVESER